MKTIIVSILLGLVSLTAYSQSKLQGAGKASKIGGTTVTQKKPSSGKSSDVKKPVSSKTTPIKKNGDSKYESSANMEITGVKFGNEDDEGHVIDKFGTKLYASEVKYLKPQLSYKGFASSEKDVTLYVKILKEDGSLEKGSNSPEGYTYKQDITVKPGANQTVLLLGWGRNSGGSFSPGLYGFEVWYKDRLVFQESVRLYSGSTPIVSSSLLKINRIAFGSEDEDDNVNIKMGDTLYEGEVKYLIGNMYYEGLYSNDQKVTLYTRIFLPSGSLSCGTESPTGFSYKREVSIKPGGNIFKITGWGNKNGTTYKEGKHKYEIWLDGEKIYETTFDVKKKEGYSSFLTVDSKTAVSTSFASFGGSETFYVKTDASSWETWGVPSWCKVTSKTSKSFSLSCERNTGAARSDWMKVKAGNKEVRIDIKQSAGSQSSIENSSGTINGHDYVDLGLPSGTKWATCNVGASSAEERGNLYAWGEVRPKSLFSVSNYFDASYNVFTLKTRSSVIGTTNDVAYTEWGEEWCMPTKDQVDELINNCQWKAGNYNGRSGMFGKGPNGNTIFFPSTGYGNENDIWYTDKDGDYFCGELCNPDKHSHKGYDPAIIPDAENSKRAYCFSFSYRYGQPTIISNGCAQRYYGRAIRPVKTSKNS